MFGMGWQELILIFLVLLFIFGAKRIPDIAQGLGKGIREFKRALKDTEDEFKTGMKEDEKKKPKINDRQDG
jgi:sec-independent protein translocase protein TatA